MNRTGVAEGTPCFTGRNGPGRGAQGPGSWEIQRSPGPRRLGVAGVIVGRARPESRGDAAQVRGNERRTGTGTGGGRCPGSQRPARRTGCPVGTAAALVSDGWKARPPPGKITETPGSRGSFRSRILQPHPQDVHATWVFEPRDENSFSGGGEPLNVSPGPFQRREPGKRRATSPARRRSPNLSPAVFPVSPRRNVIQASGVQTGTNSLGSAPATVAEATLFSAYCVPSSQVSDPDRVRSCTETRTWSDSAVARRTR